jgi:hypothetical protein
MYNDDVSLVLSTDMSAADCVDGLLPLVLAQLHLYDQHGDREAAADEIEHAVVKPGRGAGLSQQLVVVSEGTLRHLRASLRPLDVCTPQFDGHGVNPLLLGPSRRHGMA